jgi:hypothetical protein
MKCVTVRENELQAETLVTAHDQDQDCLNQKQNRPEFMVVWQGLAMDSLKFKPGPPCPTLLRPAGRQPLKQTYSRFRGGPPTGWTACGLLLPPWKPHAVRLCLSRSGILSLAQLHVVDLVHYGSRVFFFGTKVVWTFPPYR